MGMSIDEATLYMELYKRKLFDSVSDLDKDIEAYNTAIETMRKYQKMQADYENRLKADMVAMLEDLDLKIDEMYEPQFSKEGMDGFYWAQGLFKDLVQEKINALKGENETC